MEKTLFTESQRFTQWWLLLIVLSINGVFLTGIYIQLITGKQYGDNPISDNELVISTVLIVFFTILFLSLRLDTMIKRDGVYVRFFPFRLRYKHYDWNSLSKCYVRKYLPLSEYGGWGLRFSGSGTALNISGDIGLQLVFSNNKKLLIGTNKPEELEKVLKYLDIEPKLAGN